MTITVRSPIFNQMWDISKTPTGFTAKTLDSLVGWGSRPELAIKNAKQQERLKTKYLLAMAGF